MDRFRPSSHRPSNFGYDTAIKHEHDMNTNLTRYEKITKIRQKIRYEQKNEYDIQTRIS